MVPKLCFSLPCHCFVPVDLMQMKLIPGKILCDLQDWLPGTGLLLPAVSAQLWGAHGYNENLDYLAAQECAQGERRALEELLQSSGEALINR